MIKKSFRLMLLVAFALSSVMFVSCNKYDDDIERIDNELAALNATVTSLKAAVDGGAVISSVSNTTDGVKFTLSNGQSYTVNHGTAGKDGLDGKDGQNGKDGQDGKDGKNGSVVTIGENGNWFIDDVDQGINATQPYVVNNGAWYSLYVMEQVDGANAEVIEVKLPTTGSITDIKVVGINSANAIVAAPAVQLNYGFEVTAAKGLSFNGKTYAKGTYLVAAGSSLTAMVNPLDADAALYNFSLVDSKGNANYVISDVKQHMSKGAITKADPTPNKGLWTMNIAFAEGVDHSKAADRNKLAYALTTETMNGTVASAYDVVVEEKNITKVRFTAWGSLEADQDETLDLTDCFDVTGLGINYAAHDDSKVSDLRPYIVDYYFEIADKTAAAAYGAVINGNEMTVSKAGNVDVMVHVLLVDGNDFSQKVTAKFNYVAPEGTLSNVTWTIQEDDEDTDLNEQEVFLPLGDLQASLVGSMDSQLPTVSVLGWTWADGTAFDKKTVIVNGKEYGKENTSNKVPFVSAIQTAWMPTVEGMYYYDEEDEVYVKATSATTIQTPLYIKFAFDPATVFPGDFAVKLGVKKGGNTTANNDFEVPVTVSMVAAEDPITKYENYFSGNDAVVYGTPKYADNKVEFNLATLFKTTGLKFVETPKARTSSANYNEFLKDEAGNVVVKVTDTYAQNKVYGSREYTAKLFQFNNEKIAATEYVFNVTYKSAIKEGSFTTSASKTITTTEAVKFFVTDFAGVDVYGNSFYFGNTYKYNSKGEFVSVDKAMDSRIVKVEVKADNQAAKDYLTIGEMEGDTKGNDPADHFKVSRRSDLPQLVQDANCTVKVILTDAWGVKSEATVNVLVKAFGN